MAEGVSWLVREACLRARARRESELCCLYVGTSAEEESRAFEDAAREARRHGVRLALVARSSGDVAEAIRRAAEDVDARVVIMQAFDRRGLIARLRGRRMLRKIRRRMPWDRALILYA